MMVRLGRLASAPNWGGHRRFDGDDDSPGRLKSLPVGLEIGASLSNLVQQIDPDKPDLARLNTYNSVFNAATSSSPTRQPRQTRQGLAQRITTAFQTIQSVVAPSKPDAVHVEVEVISSFQALEAFVLRICCTLGLRVILIVLLRRVGTCRKKPW